jgi:hypothetical protein
MVRGRVDAWRLVVVDRGEADPVAERVLEFLAEAGFLQHRTGRVIDVAGAGAGPDHGQGGITGTGDAVENQLQALVGLADHVGSREVGPVAVRVRVAMHEDRHPARQRRGARLLERSPCVCAVGSRHAVEVTVAAGDALLPRRLLCKGLAERDHRVGLRHALVQQCRTAAERLHCELARQADALALPFSWPAALRGQQRIGRDHFGVRESLRQARAERVAVHLHRRVGRRQVRRSLLQPDRAQPAGQRPQDGFHAREQR